MSRPRLVCLHTEFHREREVAHDLDRVRLPLDTALTDFEAFLGSAAEALGAT